MPLKKHVRTASQKPPAHPEFEQIPFKMHPRVFAALGADLVTNDIVAVIELVKNSYDAFSKNVWLRFGSDREHGRYLEIEDHGTGMTKGIIENVWCVVATPFKEQHPYGTLGNKTRRVAGEKGLGRLSAARLGARLQMLTQSQGEACWELWVDWSSIASEKEFEHCAAQLRRYSSRSPFPISGTIVRVFNLKSEWSESELADLEENLGRLISPFEQLGEFNIYLTAPGKTKGDEVKIQAPKFLAHPKYLIQGNADKAGNLSTTYKFAPMSEGKARTVKRRLTWEQVFTQLDKKEQSAFNPDRANCGPFSFEIRAWEINAEGTEEISKRFDFQKANVRRAIRVHKGISVYRDGILVLPKSETARDWLGLDLRRVSWVGPRLSTSQIVGFVSISKDGNPAILDTSDRERLVATPAVAEFEKLMIAIVEILEQERIADKPKSSKDKPMEDLFSSLTAEDLLAEVIALAEEGAPVSDALPMLRTFNASLDTARKAIQERFIYYSRLATVGTIAHMLVHEIRNRTTALGSFLDFIRSRFGPFNKDELATEFNAANASVDALERLADTFLPLASRSFRRRVRHSILEERIAECLRLNSGELSQKGIRTSVPRSNTVLAVDPGELDAILLNLITNSLYWLSEVPKEQRQMEFKLTKINDGNRVRVWAHDSGPGIKEGEAEKVFWPGITRKAGGIGMGLTVASELVVEYGGRMIARVPGSLGGASFAFDLPMKDVV
ncbi:MAG: sensor histidine kinase [Candidatus Sumerlaeaceae bacterium]